LGESGVSTQSNEWIAAARLLKRSGFGATGSDIDSVVASGDLRVYIDNSFSADNAKDVGVAATPMPLLEAPERPVDQSTASALERYSADLSDQMDDLTRWWLRRLAAVEQPLVEKLTLLWHNHFATSGRKVKIAALMAAQNQKLRDQVLGKFSDLAYAMLTDAAMIKWLDGQSNRDGSPNENLAREFMELFALGHGNGYTEDDVRAGARALTGWRLRPNGDAVLLAKFHDESTKTILGVSGPIGAREFCDIVLARPESARYIADRLWRQLASDHPAPRATLRRLITAYGDDRDLAELTKAILADPEFSESAGDKISSPVEWMIGLVRSVRVDLDRPEQLSKVVSTLTALGQLPFHPPDVAGWPQGRAWLSASSASVRLRAALALVKAGDVSIVEESPVTDRIDAAGYVLGIGAWSSRSAAALASLVSDPAMLVASAANTPEYVTS
jgi:uncharacterized protein (DUF1800 family)